LDGGPDGGDFYRRIAREARSILAGDGVLLLEIGDGMGAAVAQIFRNAGGWEVPAIRHDYAGRERAAIVRRRAGCV
jgi:release factor glutamine methyltransferase